MLIAWAAVSFHVSAGPLARKMEWRNVSAVHRAIEYWGHFRALGKEATVHSQSKFLQRGTLVDAHAGESVEYGDFLAPAWSNLPDTLPNDAYEAGELAAGWPMISLRCIWYEYENLLRPPGDFVEGGVPVVAIPVGTDPVAPLPLISQTPRFAYSLNDADLRALPLLPIWSGFIVNTSCFALAWLGFLWLLRVPLRLPQVVRSFRGQCLICGYSLYGLSSRRCPECGTAPGVARRSSRLHPALACFAALTMIIVTATFGTAQYIRTPRPSALHVAAAQNDAAAVARLVKDGADVEARIQPSVFQHGSPILTNFQPSSCETTPLVWAIANDAADAVSELLRAGADPFSGLPDITDRIAGTLNQTTPVEIAVSLGRARPLRRILEQFSDEEIERLDVRQLVVHAVHVNQPESVRVLIEKGVSVSRWEEPWRTPLDIAILDGRIEIVRILLEAGADPMSQPPGSGSTPLQLAEQLTNQPHPSGKDDWMVGVRRQIVELLRQNAER